MKLIKIIVLFLIVSHNPIVAQTGIITGNKIIENGREFYLYKVQQAEGFYSIEKKFGVSRVEIVEYNPEAASGLRVGQIIKIPVVRGRNSTEKELGESAKYIFHTVEKGQSLFFISRKYGVTVDDIIRENPGANEVLIIGTELKIPLATVESKTEKKDDAFLYYTVNSGETLFSISRKNNVTVEDIIESNPGISSETLTVGSEVRIPRNKIIQPQQQSAKPDTTYYTFEDEKYFYHRVEPRQTFYSIINQYNVDEEAVLKINGIENPERLKTGYIIKIPKANIRKTEQQQSTGYLVYVVQNREEIEDIAKKFGVSVGEIEAANPDITRWKRLKKETAINIPIKRKFQVPDRVKTEIRPAIITSTESGMLERGAEAAGCGKAPFNKPVNVAVIWPFFLHRNDTLNRMSKTDEYGNTTYFSRNPKQIFPANDRFGIREFYLGLLVAIDSLSKQGIDINLFTYDSENDTNAVKRILLRPELKTMHLIIGPVYHNNVKLVASYCKNHGINMVVPYSSSEDLTENNARVFQVNPPKKALTAPVISFVSKSYYKSNVILVRSGRETPQEQQFIMQLKRGLYEEGTKNNTTLLLKEFNLDNYGFQGLERIIRDDVHNLILMPSERSELFNKIVPSVDNLVTRKKMENITLLGYPDYQKYNGTELRMLFNAQTVLYTPFYADFSAPETQKVLNGFREMFFTEPQSDYPSYGLLGFDVTYYFIHAVHSFGADFGGCLPYLKIPLTTSSFNFKRENNWSGFTNTGVKFIRYNRNYTVDVVPQK
jgi:LysM repeat protein